MIDYALHLGLSFWILAVLPSNLLRMIVLFILILWFYTYQNRNIKSYLLLCLMFLILLQQVPVFEPVNRKGIVKEVKKNMLIVSLPEEDVIVYGCKANISDEVELNGTYEPIVSNENFYGFSFKKWANTSGYYFSMNDENCKVIKESNSLKSKVYHRITSIEDEKIKEWLSSTLLHFSLDDTVFTMISSSGLYLSTAFYMLSSLLKRKCSRKVSDILSLSIVTFCAYITCTTLSFKRFFIFTVIQMLFSNESKQTRLGLCMITFLWCYPASALDMAFVLPVLFRFLSLFRFQKVPRFLLSLAILVPVQLYYFNECNFLQLFFFSFLRTYFFIGYLLSWLVLCFPLLSFLLHIFIFITNGLTYLFSFDIGISGKLSFVWFILWCKIVFELLYQNERKTQIKLIVLLAIYPYLPFLNPIGEVSFLDVGQGDCVLISLPFYQGNMLIDVRGSLYSNVPEQLIYPTLKAKGITKLNKVVITHDDLDHSGGLKELSELIKIDEVIDTKKDSFSLGNIQFHILLNDKKLEDKNENSLVLFSKIGGLTYLFMGDAGKDAENEILKEYPKFKSDIVKIGHHGSKSGSSEAFVETVDAKIGIVSSGRNNFYGHPDCEVVKRWENHGTKVLDTQKEGGITIYFSEFGNILRTVSRKFGIISGS